MTKHFRLRTGAAGCGSHVSGDKSRNHKGPEAGGVQKNTWKAPCRCPNSSHRTKIRAAHPKETCVQSRPNAKTNCGHPSPTPSRLVACLGCLALLYLSLSLPELIRGEHVGPEITSHLQRQHCSSSLEAIPFSVSCLGLGICTSEVVDGNLRFVPPSVSRHQPPTMTGRSNSVSRRGNRGSTTRQWTLHRQRHAMDWTT